jgi:hypothetical protein
LLAVDARRELLFDDMAVDVWLCVRCECFSGVLVVDNNELVGF